MPRGRKKNLTLDDQINIALKDIETLKSELSQKKAELKKLESLKNEEDISMLSTALKKSNKTFDEVMRFISDAPVSETPAAPVFTPAPAQDTNSI